ncbi:MAG TPA: GAF domain-containing protein [Syntrophales bacterium]|jgi:adenylate cyclase|nr:GAF domain-containing protein [Syntrophales bacterium]HQI35629.1 GAF domain-containing protein [Syntrophales bacterium]HQJ30854.1 GAF domain-containing protein [Syntrophales bacterium]HRR46723.1 GAF domain-containing protein [Syntrophales bacterium]
MKQDSAINKEIRLHQAELLLNVARTMASYETLDEMLSVLVEITTREIRADRGTIFLNDPETGELYSRVAQGNFQREIRIINNTGIAGHVFTTGESLIVYDAYADSRFNRSVDEKTGYVTKSILCVPIRTMKGEVIGAAQMLNKKRGRFSREDMQLLESMTTQAAITLQSIGVVEKMQKFRAKEMEFFDLVSNVTAEIDLGSLLQKVMSEATRMLNAERSTLFLNDEKHKELFSKVGEGLGAMEIRLPNHLGIAGAVFQSGETINIPYAYADLRFNPAFDRKTGFFTRSILCVPVINKAGKLIGVTQVLNKRGGTFTREDESRLRAFTAQVSIALENAKLFDDIQNMKNYSESMLESMSNGVITLNEEGRIVTCNAAGLRIMQVEAEAILERPVAEFFTGHNAWVVEKINRVVDTRKPELAMDAELAFEANKVAANITIMPLTSVEKKKLGVMIIIDDISSEKRVKSTMSRYMDPGLADQLLEGGEDILGGKSTMATILFSDIRQFTTLTEELGAQGTVSLLNEYFTIMVECIQKEGGMLDKFIGDAIMAAFGIPMAHDDDEDRAVRAAIAMINALENWNRERVSQGKRPVKMGLGLNTDVIVSGNIGSPKRMDYTLIGDGVNLASRLESLCKRYHAQILISENTYKRLRGTYRIRQVDSVVVKGKTEPVGVFEVLDYHSAESFPNLMESVNHFQEGLQSYRRQQWEGAITSFRKALGKNPADEICRMYIDRCELLKKNPPQEGWDGVWIMDSK